MANELHGERQHHFGLMKSLAIFGIVTPIVEVLFVIGLSALDPQYRHVRQFISELGEDGRPYAAVFNIWSVVYGPMFACFAVAVGRGLNSRMLMVACLTIAICGSLSGFFPCDPGCACETPTAKVHLLTGYVTLPAMILVPWLAWHAMKGKGEWRGCRFISMVCAMLLIASTGWLASCHFLGREQSWCAVGVAQRLIMAVFDIWMVVISVRLLRIFGGGEVRW